MAKKNTGFIKISRDILFDALYHDGTAFSLWKVLLDLNLRAFHTDTTKPYRNKVRHYRRGQVEGSYREFAEWWDMSKNTAKKRLEELQKEGFIHVDSSKEQTVVTLLKYCVEQDKNGLMWDTDWDTNRDTNWDTNWDTNRDTDWDNYKNDKECIKNEERMKKKEPPAQGDF